MDETPLRSDCTGGLPKSVAFCPTSNLFPIPLPNQVTIAGNPLLANDLRSDYAIWSGAEDFGPRIGPTSVENN